MGTYTLGVPDDLMRQAKKIQAERKDTKLSYTLHYLIRLGVEQHQRRVAENES